MTDREALLALLERFGLKPSAEKEYEQVSTVALAADEGGVGGYSGFVAVFDFNTDGTFKALGLYE